MKIKFVGSRVKRRLVREYEWSRKTGFVQEVSDPVLAAELLTAPDGTFVVDAEEPLCTLDGVGPQRTAELALAGIGGLADLVELSGAEVKQMAKGIWASERQVKEWVKEARLMLGEPEGADNQSTLEEVQDE